MGGKLLGLGRCVHITRKTCSIGVGYWITTQQLPCRAVLVSSTASMTARICGRKLARHCTMHPAAAEPAGWERRGFRNPPRCQALGPAYIKLGMRLECFTVLLVSVPPFARISKCRAVTLRSLYTTPLTSLTHPVGALFQLLLEALYLAASHITPSSCARKWSP
jgi:hypothetical protein